VVKKWTIDTNELGTGKTYWAVHKAPEEGRVLIITSRRAIYDQMRKEGTQKAVASDYAFKYDGIAEATTVAYLHHHIKDFINQKYKLVIVDEAHCLTADAAFAESVCTLYFFLRYIDADIHLMTSTPFTLTDYDLFDDINFEGVGDRGRGVKPKEVWIVKQVDIKNHITRNCNSEYKGICLMKSAAEAYQWEKQLCRPDIIAITSQSRGNREATRREQEVLDYLIYNEKLPDDISCILTTSKLREGINIYDDKVKFVSTERIDRINLIQMSGRVRSNGGVDLMMVAADKYQEVHIKSEEEKYKEQQRYIEALNRMYEEIKSSPLNREKFLRDNAFSPDDYICYDPIADCFKRNKGKMINKYEEHDCNQKFKEDALSYIKENINAPVVDKTQRTLDDLIIEVIERWKNHKLTQELKEKFCDEIYDVGERNASGARRGPKGIGRLVRRYGYEYKDSTILDGENS